MAPPTVTASLLDAILLRLHHQEQLKEGAPVHLASVADEYILMTRAHWPDAPKWGAFTDAAPPNGAQGLISIVKGKISLTSKGEARLRKAFSASLLAVPENFLPIRQFIPTLKPDAAASSGGAAPAAKAAPAAAAASSSNSSCPPATLRVDSPIMAAMLVLVRQFELCFKLQKKEDGLTMSSPIAALFRKEIVSHFASVAPPGLRWKDTTSLADEKGLLKITVYGSEPWIKVTEAGLALAKKHFPNANFTKEHGQMVFSCPWLKPGAVASGAAAAAAASSTKATAAAAASSSASCNSSSRVHELLVATICLIRQHELSYKTIKFDGVPLAKPIAADFAVLAEEFPDVPLSWMEVVKRTEAEGWIDMDCTTGETKEALIETTALGRTVGKKLYPRANMGMKIHVLPNVNGFVNAIGLREKAAASAAEAAAAAAAAAANDDDSKITMNSPLLIASLALIRAFELAKPAAKKDAGNGPAPHQAPIALAFRNKLLPRFSGLKCTWREVMHFAEEHGLVVATNTCQLNIIQVTLKALNLIRAKFPAFNVDRSQDEMPDLDEISDLLSNSSSSSSNKETGKATPKKGAGAAAASSVTPSSTSSSTPIVASKSGAAVVPSPVFDLILRRIRMYEQSAETNFKDGMVIAAPLGAEAKKISVYFPQKEHLTYRQAMTCAEQDRLVEVVGDTVALTKRGVTYVAKAFPGFDVNKQYYTLPPLESIIPAEIVAASSSAAAAGAAIVAPLAPPLSKQQTPAQVAAANAAANRLAQELREERAAHDRQHTLDAQERSSLEYEVLRLRAQVQELSIKSQEAELDGEKHLELVRVRAENRQLHTRIQQLEQRKANGGGGAGAGGFDQQQLEAANAELQKRLRATERMLAEKAEDIKDLEELVDELSRRCDEAMMKQKTSKRKIADLESQLAQFKHLMMDDDDE